MDKGVVLINRESNE